jgi:C4-dicarboxylate-specific signal transduction histidine kinase
LAAILINSHAGIRLLEAPTPDLKKLQITLSGIREVTERAGEVIGGLRAMFKRDSTAAPGLTTVDINNVIRFVERIVYGDANLHHVTVALDLSSDIGPVKGDSVQLQQVILNLMMNAFSAMSETDVDARRLVVRTRWNDESNILVEVEDNGTGIAEEKIEAIFSPFITSKPEGLGMGLSICRSIIERHGGKISAANLSGAGAKFSITLPAVT